MVTHTFTDRQEETHTQVKMATNARTKTHSYYNLSITLVYAAGSESSTKAFHPFYHL